MRKQQLWQLIRNLIRQQKNWLKLVVCTHLLHTYILICIVYALVHILQEEQRQIGLQNKVKAQKTLIQQQRDALQEAKGITQINENFIAIQLSML